MKKVEQIVLLYDRSNFVQVPQKIRRSAFYPSVRRFCPQISSAVYRFNDPQIRKSAFYRRPKYTYFVINACMLSLYQLRLTQDQRVQLVVDSFIHYLKSNQIYLSIQIKAQHKQMINDKQLAICVKISRQRATEHTCKIRPIINHFVG